MKESIAIYPGTFDPITLGHFDLAMRASKLFEKVIFAVAENKGKSPLFTLEERVDIARRVFETDDGVEVMPFSELLVDFVDSQGAHVIMRGLRVVSDFEFEMQLAAMNRKLKPEIETVFMTPAEKHQYLSSTMVREVARLGGDVSQFVPRIVVDELNKKLK